MKLRRILSWYYNKHLVQVFVVSYPKAGRTWLRTILGRIFSEHFNIPFSLETLNLTKKSKILPNMTFIHGRFLKKKRSEKYAKSFRNKKVIFLTRDPRDVVVSSFFQHTKRTKEYQGTISEFIRDEIYGIRHVIDFYNYWYDRKDLFKDFLLIKYENLHRKPVQEIRKVLKFLNLDFIEDKTIQEAVQFASFGHMREMEKKNKLANWRLKAADKNDLESYKTRKGKIGGFLNSLNEEDIKFVNKEMKNSLLPFSFSARA